MMKKITIQIFAAAVFAVFFSSCEEISQNTGLSDGDIVKGLKTALEVGTDSAVKITSVANGYFMDQAIKILLPPEAKVITDNIATVNKYSSEFGVDLQPYVENVIKSMNRAAEYAADSAKPILKNAVTSLSITDGLSILNGTNPAGTKKSGGFDSIAATNYLRSTCYTSLVNAYKVPVNVELDKDVLGLGFSTNQAWSTLTEKYNYVASIAQSLLSTGALNFFPEQKAAFQKLTPIQNSTLGEYVTGKALDGLFLKVGDQERSIRKDPWQWINDTVGSILQKVFGKKE
jgi:hypothetical protein